MKRFAPCTLEAVASLDNLWHAAHAARRGKSRRPDVEDWWLRRESEILRLHAELSAGTWQPGGFRFFPTRRPRVLGAAKRRFERRRHRLARCRAVRRLCVAVRAWHQFSHEGNAEGLRRAYAAPRHATAF